jgi:phosphoribosylanthranilate isomerase
LGVNSRDLDTLAIDTRKFSELRRHLPHDSFLIAESGINNMDLLHEVMDLGYHAALIGEHFLRAAQPGRELRAFHEAAELHKRSRPRVKICGITSASDAQLAIEAGADALGFVFAKSPRRIDPRTLAEFRAKIPSRVLTVGVFKDQTADEILDVVKKCALDVAQVYDAMDLPCRSWQAKIIQSANEHWNETNVNKVNNQPLLWDIKAERDRLPVIWRELSRTENVFALAGGLDPENVSDAIAVCHPQWVDVARGVERQPGIKDEKKLQGFITAARSANGD